LHAAFPQKRRSGVPLRVNADQIADSIRLNAMQEISRLTADAPLSRDEIQRRDDAAARAEISATDRPGG